MSNAGLKVARNPVDTSDKSQDGIVTNQSVGASQQVKEGTTVTLNYYKYTEPKKTESEGSNNGKDSNNEKGSDPGDSNNEKGSDPGDSNNGSGSNNGDTSNNGSSSIMAAVLVPHRRNRIIYLDIRRIYAWNYNERNRRILLCKN